MMIRICCCVLLLFGCQGVIGEVTPPEPFDPNGPIDPDNLPSSALAETPEQVAFSGARRLSRGEIERSMLDLLGVQVPAVELLPEESQEREGLFLHWAFDNNYSFQTADKVLVQAYERLASTAADLAVADGFVEKRFPCVPSGSQDFVCLEEFVSSFGRRAFRRPLDTDEVANFMTLSVLGAENDIDYVVKAMLTAFLQSPDFLYRVETHTDEAMTGVYRLTDYEIASRISFFVLGQTPSEALLDAAEASQLSTSEGRRAAFQTLLDDPRVRRQVDNFHAQWLGYQQLPHSADLTRMMREETRALLDRVIFEDEAPYVEIFRAAETFVAPELAAHYELDSPGDSADWVTYGSGRGGILSHGSVLAAFASGGDTSVTRRGVYVRERLLCETLQPPPPNVNVDDIPETECKSEEVEAHQQGACGGCHALMDPIGWGLENFDLEGRFREHDPGKPQCTIDGKGSVGRFGEFTGPGELSHLLADNGVTDCAVRHAVRFALGREELADDIPYIQALTQELGPDFRFLQLMESIVVSDRFALRREDSGS